MILAVRPAPKSGFLGVRLGCGDIHALKRCFILTISLSLYSRSTCVSIRDLAGGKTGGKRGHSGMPGSFLKEPAPQPSDELYAALGGPLGLLPHRGNFAARLSCHGDFSRHPFSAAFGFHFVAHSFFGRHFAFQMYHQVMRHA